MSSDWRVLEEVQKLFDGVSDSEIRELCIKALRSAHAKGHVHDGQVQLHGHLGRELLPLLADRKNVALSGSMNNLSNVFIDDINQQSWMSGVFEFVVWFVRAGLAWPLGALPNQTPITLRLTNAGLRLVASDSDHPLLAGAVERVADRCPGLPEGVIALLVQSKVCLDHGLMQAAISLMGVAYETAVEHVVDVLVDRNLLPANVQGFRAAQRIAAVKAKIDAILPGATASERDDRFATHAAYDFADQLRRRRNDASHTAPTYGFEDRDEAEELLVSAGRHLPNLWRLAR